MADDMDLISGRWVNQNDIKIASALTDGVSQMIIAKAVAYYDENINFLQGITELSEQTSVWPLQNRFFKRRDDHKWPERSLAVRQTILM